jgi:hypothetical protein
VDAAGIRDDGHHGARFVRVEQVADAGKHLLVEVDRVHHRQLLVQLGSVEADEVGHLLSLDVDDAQDLSLLQFRGEVFSGGDRFSSDDVIHVVS